MMRYSPIRGDVVTITEDSRNGKFYWAEDVNALLQRWLDAAPAFRTKPLGAPGSCARAAQDEHIALEDATRACLQSAVGTTHE